MVQKAHLLKKEREINVYTKIIGQFWTKYLLLNSILVIIICLLCEKIMGEVYAIE